MCTKCIKETFKDGKIPCSVCNMVNLAKSCDDFPLNMAIMEADLTKENNVKVTKPSSPPSKLIETTDMISLESICQKHGKKFEGK
jgi:hypothetical protein